jgi:hypothetical protein
MRKWLLIMGLGVTLSGASAQTAGPPHAWIFGTWTGGYFPAADNSGPSCTGQPSVIFTRDVVMRSSPLDVTYQQRVIETAAAQPNGLEFRFSPVAQRGARLPPGTGFGCAGDPDLLRVERRGPDEIVFPDCADFPAPLKRCVGP